jgi:hypothetical protein
MPKKQDVAEKGGKKNVAKNEKGGKEPKGGKKPDEKPS